MSQRLVVAAGTVEVLTGADAVWDHAVATLAAEGIEIVIYLAAASDVPQVRLLTNRPEIHAGNTAPDDPFLTWLCEDYVIHPTGVAYLSQHDYLPEDEKDFIRRAGQHGFQTGLAIPMRLSGSPRFGGFNLGTSLTRDAFEARIFPKAESLRFFCLVVHRRLEELGFDAPIARNSDDGFRDRLVAPPSEALEALSPREREVIYLQALGLRRKEVARMCGISPYTVAEYTAKAYRKLGVHNRSQAARLVFGA